MPGTLRLFLAVEVPRSVAEEAFLAARPYVDLPGARGVPVADAHVTVRFIGPVLAGREPEIGAAAGAAARAVSPGVVSLRGLGAFPAGRLARVLWAGVQDDGTLSALAARLAEGLAGALPEPVERTFRPHITLARFDPPARLTDLPEGLFGDPFPVERLALFRSHPGVREGLGGRYEALGAYPLGG